MLLGSQPQYLEDPVVSRKTSAGAVAVFVTVALTGLTGCMDGDKTSQESRSFEFSGNKLTIDVDGPGLRVVPGGNGSSVEVERTLKGSANGNASWSLENGTLKLSVDCSGIVLDCEGRHTVKVPKNTEIALNGSGSKVEIRGMAGELTAIMRDSPLKIVDPSGNLALNTVGESAVVTGARSRQVTAEARSDGRIQLSFASAPQRVVAHTTEGNLTVNLPRGSETYRITAPKNSGNVASDSGSDRIVELSSNSGRVRVTKAG